MSHDEVLVAWLESGTLDAEGEAHLATCEACRSLLDEIDASRGSLAEAFPWEEPAPGLEDAVVAAVGAAAASPPAAPPAPVAPSTRGATPPARPASIVDLDARRGRAVTWIATAVAAAACVIAVVAV